MTGKKFVAYFRVSTERQGRSGLGLEAQKSAVAVFLNGDGHELLAEFVEVESGKLNARPKLAEALALCKKRKAVLVIAKLDRLSRNVAFIATLMDAGVEFVAVDMPHATPLTIHILAAVAQHEREMISKRTKAALQAAKARGQVLGWALPARSGEALAASAKSATITKARADTFAANVAAIIASVQAAGATSLRELADALNARGVRTSRGGTWHASTVRNYIGRAARLD